MYLRKSCTFFAGYFPGTVIFFIYLHQGQYWFLVKEQEDGNMPSGIQNGRRVFAVKTNVFLSRINIDFSMGLV